MIRRIRTLHPRIRQQRHVVVRTLAVYAVGEGWTGALGTESLDLHVPGHFDDELHEEEEEEKDGVHTAPHCMFDGPVHDVAVGWGHTALITHRRELLLTGRPHDFSALLRLRRLPEWLRQYSVRQTLELTNRSDNDDRYDITSPTQLVGGMVNWLSNLTSTTAPPEEQQPDWEMARQHSVLPTLTPIKGIGGDPAAVACSAGFSAVITQDGHLYTFGLNGYGQCGIGRTSNNVWQPTRVTTGLSAHSPVTAVALGFQHAICLDADGQMYCWGKGERGQLGQRLTLAESSTPLPVEQTVSLVDTFSWPDDIERVKPSFQPIGSKVTQIAAGMLHSAALTDDHRVLLWGKYVLPAMGDNRTHHLQPASDATLPFVLPLHLPRRVEQIACGSHHTSMLLEDGSVWAVGLAADTSRPIHAPQQILPPGVLELPVRQFAAHMDRTTVVGRTGRQVLQLSLWEENDDNVDAAFAPIWLDRLLQTDQNMRIREVHRGWVHSVVVTD